MKLLFFLFILAALLTSCTEPNNPSNNDPDTTSHNFTWEILNFGGQTGGSFFKDVAIVNENNIWAVGEIFTEDSYTYDSLGNWILPYNAAHWDGEKWELKRILYKGSFWDIATVFALNEHDIWFEAFMRWDGQRFYEMEIPDIMVGIGIKKTWGISSSAMYTVSNNGQIRYYNGQDWSKIESGTDLNINDIYGAENKKTGEVEIYCVASNHLSDPEYRREILKIKSDNTVIKISTEPISWTLYSLWFSPGEKYFVAGSGIYEKDTFSDSLWQSKAEAVVQYYTYRIRGNSENDIVAVGGSGDIVHYNGNSWKSFLPETDLSWGNYYSVDILNDIIIAVGSNNTSAVITIGTRTN